MNTILERLDKMDEARVRLSCDETAFSGADSKFLSIAKLSYSQRVVRGKMLLFKLNLLLHH